MYSRSRVVKVTTATLCVLLMRLILARLAAQLRAPAAERMPVGVRGNHRLLHARQELLRLGQRQPQRRDIAKVAGRPDLHGVDTWSGAIRLGFGQPQNPPHPRSPGRQRPNRSYRLRPHPQLSGHSRRFTKKRVGSPGRCNRNQETRFKRGNGLYREILALFAFGLQRDEPLRCATPTRPCFAGRTAVFYGRTRPLADRLCRFPAHRNWSTLSGITLPTISASDIPRAWARAVTSSMKLRFSPSVFSSIRTVARWTTSRRATTPRPSRDFRNLSRSTPA